MKKYIDMSLPFLDRKEVCLMTLRSKSQLQLDINEGLFPPQIKIGDRRAVYLTSEVNEMIGLWVEGLTPDKIKLRIKLMVSSRSLP